MRVKRTYFQTCLKRHERSEWNKMGVKFQQIQKIVFAQYWAVIHSYFT